MSDIHITRKKGESFEAMFRRFTRRFRSSGKQFDVRNSRFFERKPSKNKMKASKLRSMKIAQDIDYKLRTGKMTEDDLRGRRRRRRR